jgi:hypothetical protein
VEFIFTNEENKVRVFCNAESKNRLEVASTRMSLFAMSIAHYLYKTNAYVPKKFCEYYCLSRVS